MEVGGYISTVVTQISERSRSVRIHWSKSDTVGIPSVGDTSTITVVACCWVFGPQIRSKPAGAPVFWIEREESLYCTARGGWGFGLDLLLFRGVGGSRRLSTIAPPSIFSVLN